MPLAKSRSGLQPVPEHVRAPVVKEVTVKLEPKEIHANADGIGWGEVIILIPEDLHINDHSPPARWLTPTALTFEPITAKVAYPPAVDYSYVGEVRIPFEVSLPTGSSGEEFEIRVSYQACTQTECLLPSEKTLSGVLART